MPHRAAHAVAGDQPFGVERVAAVGRLDLDRDSVIARPDAHHLVARAKLDPLLGQACLVEIFLDVVLLQVHEGRELVAGLGRQIEPIDRLVAQIDLAFVPGDALLDHAPGDAEAIPDLEAVLGLADRAAAEAHRVVVVEQHGRHATRRQRQRQGRAGDTRAHDHDRPARALAVEFSGATIRVVAVFVGTHREWSIEFSPRALLVPVPRTLLPARSRRHRRRSAFRRASKSDLRPSRCRHSRAERPSAVGRARDHSPS